MTVYVDADHAYDQVSRRSVTGIVVMLNNTIISAISKRQMTVETSTYGSELIAARTAVEMIVGMRYQLRMMGVNLDGPTVMFGDNMSVVISTTIPSSMLKKKHLAIAYHKVREAVAAGTIVFGHIISDTNIADICTKPLPNEGFHNICGPTLFRNPLTKPLIPLPIDKLGSQEHETDGDKRENEEVVLKKE